MSGVAAASGPVAPVDARRAWVQVGAWSVLVAALVVGHLLWPTGAPGKTTYLVAVVGAGVLAWIAWLRQRPEDRRAAAFVAAGLSANAIAEVIWEIVAKVNGTPPDLSVGDVFWLLSYVMLIIAVLGPSSARPRPRTTDVDGLIDLAAFTVIALLVVGDLTNLGSILDDGTTAVSTRLVWAAYPVLDAALLAVFVRAIAIGRMRGRTGAIMCLGVGSWLAADFAFALDADGSWTRWSDAGWMLGPCALAAAIASPSSDRAAFDGDVRPVRTGRILMNLVPLLVPWAIVTVAWAEGRGTSPVPLVLATVALLVCAALRATRLARARDEHQARLLEREHYYRVLADNSSDAVAVIDRHGRLLVECPPIAEMLGQPSLAVPGGNVLMALPQEERGRMAASLEWLWRTPAGRSEADVAVTDARRRARWFHLRAVNLRDDPAIGAIVVNFSDITERKRAENELAHHAFHDALTGLPNRALFRDRVEHALRRVSSTQARVAVIFLDLDGFKRANDRFGHPVGDELLSVVAARLADCVRDSDTVARLGGDEFAILIERRDDPLTEAIDVADRILKSMTAPFHLEEQCLALSASLGIAVADAGATEATLLRDADIAMYRSKSSGRRRWTVYDNAMRVAALERMELELDLADAVGKRQLRLAYQPIVRLDTEAVVGFEALVRWDHPTRGEIDPTAFIPIAEATGAILAIGDWVIDEACRTAARWRADYPSVQTSMGVNVSARQLADPDIVGRVSATLARHGLEPQALVLEMTESVLVEDPEAAAARLGALRRLGVRLAIDDFGTGYSSLSYLRQFPIDILKVDRSFIASITDGSEVPAIVRGVLDLGRTLALETVAEGIEEGGQLASLRREQCEFGQGFLFAQPLDSRGAEALVAGMSVPSTSA